MAAGLFGRIVCFNHKTGRQGVKMAASDESKAVKLQNLAKYNNNSDCELCDSCGEKLHLYDFPPCGCSLKGCSARDISSG